MFKKTVSGPILTALWLACAIASPRAATVPSAQEIVDACRDIKRKVAAGERVGIRLHGLRIVSGQFDKSIFIVHGYRPIGVLDQVSQDDPADCAGIIEALYRTHDLTSDPP